MLLRSFSVANLSLILSNSTFKNSLESRFQVALLLAFIFQSAEWQSIISFFQPGSKHFRVLVSSRASLAHITTSFNWSDHPLKITTFDFHTQVIALEIQVLLLFVDCVTLLKCYAKMTSQRC